MQLLYATARKSIQCGTSGRPAQRGRLGAGQAAGLSLPGAVHSAPFMKASFGVCAR
jgi:hypothetical protein